MPVFRPPYPFRRVSSDASDGFMRSGGSPVRKLPDRIPGLMVPFDSAEIDRLFDSLSAGCICASAGSMIRCRTSG